MPIFNHPMPEIPPVPYEFITQPRDDKKKLGIPKTSREIETFHELRKPLVSFPRGLPSMNFNMLELEDDSGED